MLLKRRAIADFLLAAWLAWMTPLETALSSLVEAFFRASSAAEVSPLSAASRNLRIQVRSSDLYARLRSVRLALVLTRLIWDLMFATKCLPASVVGGCREGDIARPGT